MSVDGVIIERKAVVVYDQATSLQNGYNNFLKQHVERMSIITKNFLTECVYIL